MTDLRDRINGPAEEAGSATEKIAIRVPDDGKGASVEPYQIDWKPRKKVKNARKVLEKTLRPVD